MDRHHRVHRHGDRGNAGGRLADRFGRRKVFATTLVIYGLATGASALVGGLALFMVLRFLVGLGLGAELPVASTLVSELSPTRIRGRLVVVLESFWALGWILAAVIGFYVIPHGDNGWRWGLAIGLIPAAYALVVRFSLPESAVWLESRGRHEEAEAVVRGFEESAGVVPGTTKGSPSPSTRRQRPRTTHPSSGRSACAAARWASGSCGSG